MRELDKELEKELEKELAIKEKIDSLPLFKVEDYFDISHLHFSDSKYWKRIHDMVIEKYPEEEVTIDFEGIQLINAWESEYFVNMVKHENLYFKVYFNATLAEAIDLLCKTNIPQLKTDRVYNHQPTEVIEKPKFVISPTEVKAVEGGITTDGNELRVKYVYSAIERIESIMALDSAIRNSYKGEKVIVIDLDEVILQKMMINELYNMNMALEKEFGVKVNCINMYSQKEYDMCVKFGPNININNLSKENRIEIISNHLPKNAIVILVKYKDTRAVKDAFNLQRQWSRYARFDGFVNGKAKFTTFRQESFHTPYHLERTESKYNKVEKVEVYVEPDGLGFWDYFLGANYHVNFAVQFDREMTHEEWYLDCDGEPCCQKFTVPDYIELVAEENEIKYNREHLQDCRENTYKFLKIKSSDELNE